MGHRMIHCQMKYCDSQYVSLRQIIQLKKKTIVDLPDMLIIK